MRIIRTHNIMYTKPTQATARLRPLFGSFCAIEALGPPDVADRAIVLAFDAMADTQRRMHPTGEGSDLARIAVGGGESVAIGEATWQLLALAKNIGDASQGVFDPCLPTLPGVLKDVQLLENFAVICHSPIAIDLGGIAKGYAVDQAIDVLRHAGCTGGLVNAGGDLRVFGPTQKIVLRDAHNTTQAVSLCDSALAVTDVHAANAPTEHRGYYCRSGNRSRRRTRAALIAPSAAVADALTKCALYLDDDELLLLLRQFCAMQVQESLSRS
jgi:FAD:protein FMN transferase